MMKSDLQNNIFTKHPVLFEDNALIVIDKPPGVLSHPNSENRGGFAKGAAAFEGKYDFNERRFDTPGGPVWLVHRLDQNTSGVLIAARTKEASDNCRVYFENLRVKKLYLTLLYGRPKPDKGTWKDFIEERRQSGAVRVRIRPGGRTNAELKYRVIEFFPANHMSFVEIELVTGKTHQIRAQSAYRHYPVAGDDVYGNFSWNKTLKKDFGLKRIFLHALEIVMPHPASEKTIRLSSEVPKDLLDLIKKVGK